MAKEIQGKEKPQKYYRELVEKAGVAILIDDKEGNFMFSNKKFADIFGYSVKEMLKNSIKDIVHLDYIEKVMEIHRARVRGEQVPTRYEFKGITKEKKPIWLEVHAEEIKKNGKIIGTRSYLWEITDYKKREEYMNYLVHHDLLTGLANRTFLYEKFDLDLIHLKRYEKLTSEKRLMSLMYLDLDYFKSINDNYGHHFGDILLKNVARKLETCVREGDTLARLGGDEFVILYSHIAEEKNIKTLADRAHNVFQKPFNISNKEVNITTSVGISVYPKDGEGIDELMINADKALYVAKRKGRNRYEFFKQKTE